MPLKMVLFDVYPQGPLAKQGALERSQGLFLYSGPIEIGDKIILGPTKFKFGYHPEFETNKKGFKTHVANIELKIF